jgi:hypothetical protein
MFADAECAELWRMYEAGESVLGDFTFVESIGYIRRRRPAGGTDKHLVTAWRPRARRKRRTGDKAAADISTHPAVADSP